MNVKWRENEFVDDDHKMFVGGLNLKKRSDILGYVPCVNK